jgi:uncharacterized membrane protein HdeD (DUF308 family)
MSMFQVDPGALDEEARRLTGAWWLFVVAGLAVAAVGVLLLANPFEAATTLALLVALALALEGIEELLTASRYRPAWAGYLIGALYLVVAVWAVAWPDITLWALAVVVGIGLLVTGVVRLVAVLRFHHELPYRWLFLLGAVASIAIGVLALAWPEATVLVLAVILGVRVVIAGLTILAFGLGLRGVHQVLT